MMAKCTALLYWVAIINVVVKRRQVMAQELAFKLLIRTIACITGQIIGTNSSGYKDSAIVPGPMGHVFTTL